MPDLVCKECGKQFLVKEETMAKYPGWTPSRCYRCNNPPTAPREENLTVKEVLAKHTLGPTTGVFTDGAAEPNPGPGGWGTVYVVNDKIIAEDHGHEAHTTNNRMEILALIAACRLIPEGVACVVYTDSQLCVNTFNTWAYNWEAKGWKRKGKVKEIKNLDLVQKLHAILKQLPEIKLEWIKAHAGNRWNEYADSLATAYRRKEK